RHQFQSYDSCKQNTYQKDLRPLKRFTENHDFCQYSAGCAHSNKYGIDGADGKFASRHDHQVEADDDGYDSTGPGPEAFRVFQADDPKYFKKCSDINFHPFFIHVKSSCSQIKKPGKNCLTVSPRLLSLRVTAGAVRFLS